MTYSANSVFTDWLTVTTRPDRTSAFEVQDFILANGWSIDRSVNKKVTFQNRSIAGHSGTIAINENARFVSISCSGSALAILRAASLFNDYLSILASTPHKVTRLDAALDVERDTPNVLRSLHRAYPAGLVDVGTRTVRTTEHIQHRGDGKRSGTFYIGQRGKNRIVRRIYDKQLELLEVHGLFSPICTRYEIEFSRSVGATLRDAADPYLIFWNHCQVMLLTPPSDLAEWVPKGEYFSPEKMPPSNQTPYQILQRKIQYSGELESIFLLAQKLGSNWKPEALKLLRAKFDELERIQLAEELLASQKTED